MNNQISLDANESIFFERELESIKTQTYDRLFPEYTGLQYIPVSTDAGNYAESIKYRSFTPVGIARVLATYGQDLPRADIFGTEHISPVRALGASYGYSVQEIRAAQSVGRNLPTLKATAARRAIEAGLNDIAWNGDAEHGLQGFIVNSNYNEYNIPDGAGASPLWENKTPYEIYLDCANALSASTVATEGVEIADTLLLPRSAYEAISIMPYSANSDLTILEYIKRNKMGVDIFPVDQLESVGGGRRMIAYKRDPEKVTFELTQPFEQFPAQQRGLEFIVPCHARTGGVIVPYPLSVTFADGF